MIAKEISEIYPDIGNIEELVARWEKAFPSVDLVAEAHQASSWETANPRRKKKLHGQFLNNWFSRAQKNASSKSVKRRGLTVEDVWGGE